MDKQRVKRKKKTHNEVTSRRNDIEIVDFIKTPGLTKLSGSLKHVSRVKAIATFCVMQSSSQNVDRGLEMAAKIQTAKYNHFESVSFPDHMKMLYDEILKNGTPNSQYLISLINYVMFDWHIYRGNTNGAVTCVNEAKSCLGSAEPGVWSADIHEAQAWMWLTLAMKIPKYGLNYKDKAFKSCQLAREHYQQSTSDTEELSTKSVHYLSMMLFITLQIPLYKTVLQERKIDELWNSEKNFTSTVITWGDVARAEHLLLTERNDLSTCTSKNLSKWKYAAEVLIYYGEIFLCLRKSQLQESENKLTEAIASIEQALKVCTELLALDCTNYTKLSIFLIEKMKREIKPLVLLQQHEHLTESYFSRISLDGQSPRTDTSSSQFGNYDSSESEENLSAAFPSVCNSKTILNSTAKDTSNKVYTYSSFLNSSDENSSSKSSDVV